MPDDKYGYIIDVDGDVKLTITVPSGNPYCS